MSSLVNVSDLQRQKQQVLAASVVIAYAFMHFFLNGQYTEVTFSKLIAFDVIKPYAYRVLLPAVGYLAKPIAPPFYVFFILEVFFSWLIYFSMRRLCEKFFKPNQAFLLTLLFFLCLSLVFIINYRFAVERCGTFFFPYDTPAVAFTTLGLYLCLEKKFPWLYALIAVATLNRETSVLVCLMLPALYHKQLKVWLKPFIVSMTIYLLIRLSISWLLRLHGGSVIEIHNLNSGFPHLSENMFFLLNRYYLFWIFAEMAFLPVVLFTFYDYVPKTLASLKYVAAAYVIGLFIVGNIIEGRIFGEVTAILFLPSACAIHNWLLSKPVIKAYPTSITGALRRMGVPLFFGLCFALGTLVLQLTT